MHTERQRPIIICGSFAFSAGKSSIRGGSDQRDCAVNGRLFQEFTGR